MVPSAKSPDQRRRPVARLKANGLRPSENLLQGRPLDSSRQKAMRAPHALTHAKTRNQPIVRHPANTASNNSLAPPLGIMDRSSFHQSCGWLPARLVLPRQLHDGANDLVKYGVGSILLLVVSSSALGGNQPTQCFSIEKNVRANGHGASLGYYRAQASVSQAAGSAFVSFSVSMPDTPQALLGENIKATHVSPTTYKFRFVDDWGNHSKGLLTISGKRANLNLTVEKLGPIPSNIIRNHGESVLNKSSCQ